MKGFSTKRRQIRLFPPMGVLYFLGSILSLFVILLIADRVMIPYYEEQGVLAGWDWVLEDGRINLNNAGKNLAGYKPDVWRSLGFPVSKRKKTAKRILVIGDSFVWGDGVANFNDIWWRRLQRELNQRGYGDVEVIAAGTNGLSTHAELDMAREVIPLYEPDAIIWDYVTNDPDEGMVPQYSSIAAVNVMHDHKFARFFPNITQLLLSRWNHKQALLLGGEKNGYEYYQWEYKLLEPPNFDVYRKTVQDLGEYIRALKIPVFVMTVPNSPNEAAFSRKHAAVRPLFEQNRIPFFDILPDMLKKSAVLTKQRAANPLSWGANPANGHPGAWSTQFFASEAADILMSHYAEVLGPKKAIPSSGVRLNDWVPYDLNPNQSPGGAITFQYPESEKMMLRMPGRRAFLQLNLENPADLKGIDLIGNDLESSKLCVTYEGQITCSGKQTGTHASWSPKNASQIDTIRVFASFRGTNRSLTLNLHQGLLSP